MGLARGSFQLWETNFPKVISKMGIGPLLFHPKVALPKKCARFGKIPTGDFLKRGSPDEALLEELQRSIRCRFRGGLLERRSGGGREVVAREVR